MIEEKISLQTVQTAVSEFKNTIVAESLRPKIRVTDIYRIRDAIDGTKAHWPKKYGDVWQVVTDPGVYLHFDKDDQLIYVGSATTSIGGRLGNYFEYAKDKNDKSCRIKDEALTDSYGVRAIVLDQIPLKFLTLALEWYLIDTLNPPINKNLKRRIDSSRD